MLVRPFLGSDSIFIVLLQWADLSDRGLEQSVSSASSARSSFVSSLMPLGVVGADFPISRSGCQGSRAPLGMRFLSASC